MRQPDLAAFAEKRGWATPRCTSNGWTPAKVPLAGHRDDGRSVYPASMIKVPLAVAVGQAIDDGRLRWDTPVDGRPAQRDLQRRALADGPGLPDDRRGAGRRCMLQRSDNVATNQLYDLLGPRARDRRRPRARASAQTFFRRKLSGALPLIDDPAGDRAQQRSRPRKRPTLFAAIAAGPRPASGRAAPRSSRRHGGTSSCREASSPATRSPTRPATPTRSRTTAGSSRSPTDRAGCWSSTRNCRAATRRTRVSARSCGASAALAANAPQHPTRPQE